MLANSILLTAVTRSRLYEFIAAIASPFVFWLMVVIISRWHPGILPRIYPPIKVFLWLTYFALVWGLLYSLRTNQNLYIFMAINFTNGMNLVHTWIRRRVDPDSYKKYEGWWPMPKDSSGSGITKNL
jgi:flagellar biosynthesis protein FliR